MDNHNPNFNMTQFVKPNTAELIIPALCDFKYSIPSLNWDEEKKPSLLSIQKLPVAYDCLGSFSHSQSWLVRAVSYKVQEPYIYAWILKSDDHGIKPQAFPEVFNMGGCVWFSPSPPRKLVTVEWFNNALYMELGYKPNLPLKMEEWLK